MQKNYYVVLQGEQQGPLTFANLLKVTFTEQTLVWTPGLNNWINVSNVDDLIGKLGGDVQQPESIGKLAYTNPEADIRTATLLNHYQTVSPGKRLLGFVINWVFIMIGAGIIKSTNAGMWFVILFLPVTSLLTYYLWAGNIGHKLLRMKVINARTGQDEKSPVVGMFRELLKGFFYLFFIPVMWLLWDKKNQNLYDKLFDTLVVKDQPLPD